MFAHNHIRLHFSSGFRGGFRRFGGFGPQRGPLRGPPRGAPGPPRGGPFGFGPGPVGRDGFMGDFQAIGGGPQMNFNPPNGPPNFDQIRRDNGGLPVWGGAGK